MSGKMEMYAVGELELQLVHNNGYIIQFEAPAVEGYVLGRSDDSSQYEPDIDLSDAKAREQGVSRRHAALVRYRGMVHIVDLNSSNGTFLNDEKLAPDAPYAVSSGDILKLGNLELQITQISQ